MRILRTLAATLVGLALAAICAAAQTWTPLTHQPSFPAGAMVLLTDGSVLIHEEQDSNYGSWYKLTPDVNGSYVNGTITPVASLPSGYGPWYFGSAVLPDGRLIIEGGEYNLGGASWTNKGAIYDPVANTWTSVSPPSGWAQIGDGSSVVLANGTYMQGDCCDQPVKTALFNASTLTWTSTGSGKFDVYDEEGLVLLPNGNVLDVDAYVFKYLSSGTNSEIYNASTGTYATAGSTGPQLWDSAATCGGQSAASFEVGPAVLRPDGTVFATGANKCAAGHTSIYNATTGTWSAGPDFPNSLDIADGPAALERNGNVVMMASPGVFGTGSVFLEWDGTTLTQIPGPPNAATDSSFYGHFLELPTGSILFTDFSSDIEVFTPRGTFNPAWQPHITAITTKTLHKGQTYKVQGTQFNGVSQGAMYGDDYQDATNYPLVWIINKATKHVFYARTHDHSSMGVQTGSTVVSTNFDVPTGVETGASQLRVVTNGIPSNPVDVTVQ